MRSNVRYRIAASAKITSNKTGRKKFFSHFIFALAESRGALLSLNGSDNVSGAVAGRRCASCHTDSYAETKAVARLAGQREDYLVRALRDYKKGVRSGGGMAAMAEVAYPLSEEEITALAHYLAHL